MGATSGLTILFPVTFREGGYGENEFSGPGRCRRLPGSGIEARRRKEGAGGNEQRIRELRRERDKEKPDWVALSRRERQGGHRGQHRHAPPAVPRRLYGNPDGQRRIENLLHKCCGGRADTVPANRRGGFGADTGAGGRAARENPAGVCAMGRHDGVRRGRPGELLQAPTARLHGIPDERGQLCAAAVQRAGGEPVRNKGANHRGGPHLFP